MFPYAPKVLITICFFLYTLFAFAELNQPQADNTDSIVYILTYGYPLRNYQSTVYDKLAYIYGFKYLSVGGCVIDYRLESCVLRLNTVAYEYLELRNGKGWQERFGKGVDSMFAMRDSALVMVNRVPAIAAALKRR